MKKLLTVFLVLLLLAVFAVPVFADEEPAEDGEMYAFSEGELESFDGEPTAAPEPVKADRFVWDDAGLLSSDELDELEELCGRLTDEHGFGVYIMTVYDFTDYGEGEVYDVCTQLYLKKGMGVGSDADGIFLILSMDERDFAFCAHGYGEKAITAYTRGIVEQAFLDNFRKNDWYGGFTDYAETSVEVVEDFRAGKYDDKDYYEDYNETHEYAPKGRFSLGKFLINLIAPLGIAGVTCGIKSSKHKTVKQAVNAENYILPKSLNIYRSEDIYTHTTESRRYISSDSSRSGGGGGSSFHSGGGFSGSSGKF